MIPPSGAAGGGQAMKVPGLSAGKGGQGGYNSGNEGQASAVGGGPGIEIDPFTGIPYYDASKAGKGGKSGPAPGRDGSQGRRGG